MYDTSSVDVLIAGAGPTGLTLALDLARRRVPFRILESAGMPFEGSRGKGLQPRTLEIFDNLGIIEQIHAAGGLYPAFRTHVGPVSTVGGSLGSAREPTEGVPYPNLWMVPQSRTEAILRERLSALGGSVEFGSALISFIDREHGVEATLATGEVVHARFLAGCDGGRSTVRKLLGVRLQGEVLDKTQTLVADVEIDGLDREQWHLWPFAKGGVLGLCPLPGTSLFQCNAKAEASNEGIDAQIPERIHRITGYEVKRIAWSSTYQPAVRMVDRFRVGSVFLLGDAAHMHPPSGGQGLNTGVQDAWNLAWKLAYVLRGATESLLDSYEEERLPVAAAVLGLSKQLHQTRSIKRSEATDQLALHYRASSLSRGEPIGKLHPGDRMPNRNLANGETLFQRMRSRHATVCSVSDGTYILVRPDGYIADIGPRRFNEYMGQSIEYAEVCLATQRGQ